MRTEGKLIQPGRQGPRIRKERRSSQPNRRKRCRTSQWRTPSPGRTRRLRARSRPTCSPTGTSSSQATSPKERQEDRTTHNGRQGRRNNQKEGNRPTQQGGRAMPQFLTTSGISHEMERIIREAKQEVIIVSPYLKNQSNPAGIPPGQEPPAGSDQAGLRQGEEAGRQRTALAKRTAHR